jgi:Ca2+/Na+ antiporter
MTWEVENPKGRIACMISAIVWTLLMALIVLNGDWSLYHVLLMVLFALLLVLSVLRIFQEWKEEGEWLE